MTIGIEELDDMIYECDFTEYTLGDISYAELKTYIEGRLKETPHID